MALPSGITPKTITIGIASFFDGSIASGRVTISAPVNVIHTPTNRPIFSSDMTQPFVDGAATFNLCPTDAPGLNRVDWVYKAKIEVAGASVQPDPIYFTLPTAGPDTVDLDGLVTVPSSAGVPIAVNVLTAGDLDPLTAGFVASGTSQTGAALKTAFDARYPALNGVGKVPSALLPDTRSPVRIPASLLLDTGTGTSTRTMISRWASVQYASGTGTVTSIIVPDLPADWTLCDVSILWTNPGTGTGKVAWRADILPIPENGTITQPPSGTLLTEIAQPQNVIQRTWIARQAILPGQGLVLVLLRSGNNDTLPNAAAALEITLRKATPLTTAIPNLAWYWLTRSRATWWSDGNLYTAGIANDATQQVVSWNPTTNAVTRTTIATSGAADDHSNPALVMAPGKPTVVLWNNHAGDTKTHVRVSTANESIAAYGPDMPVEMGGTSSYLEVFRRGSELHVFARTGPSYGVNQDRWTYVWTADIYAATPVWSVPVNVVNASGDHFYMSSVLLADGKTLRCAFNAHPSTTQTPSNNHSVYYAEIDLSTGDVKSSAGAVKGNIRTGANMPLNPYTALEKAFDCPSNRTVNLFDVSDGPNPEIGFSVKDYFDASTTNSGYVVATRKNGTWSTATVAGTGERWGYGPHGYYVGGIAFPPSSPGGVLALTRNFGGDGWAAEKWQTDATGTWQLTKIYTTGGRRLARPWFIEGVRPAGVSYEILFEAIASYDFATYFNWNIDIGIG